MLHLQTDIENWRFKCATVQQCNYLTMEDLDRIKTAIESMNKYNQVEILKILNKTDCKLNENKSGVYVNLSFLSEDTLMQLRNYISYTRDQEDTLITMEYQKEEFKNSYFIEKEDKDNATVLYSSISQAAK